MTFNFKTTPYKHQLECFELSKDAPYWGILFEQRCGKTKVAIDTAAYQYHKGVIDALLIIAPNNVHVNWVRDELPTHMPDDVKPMVMLWQSNKMGLKYMQKQAQELLKHNGLAILAVNVDAIITPKLRDYLTEFFRARTVMTVIDESLDISAHDSKRTEIALKIGRRSRIRRILDGTPSDATPLGLYSQCDFLQPGLLGQTNFFAFKRRYAVLERRDVGQRNRMCPDCVNGTPDGEVCLRCAGTGWVGNREIQTVTGYKNLPELNERLMNFCTRVTRAQCADLPPKIYQKEFFQLSPKQRKHYDELRDDARTEFQSGTVSVALALTRIMRLQQITSNHIPIGGDFAPCPQCLGDGCEHCLDTGVVEEPRTVKVVDEENDPRADALERVVSKLDGQGIVWAKFKPDVDTAIRVLKKLGKKVGRYDGTTSVNERVLVKEAFQRGEIDVIVGNSRAGGRGIDLSCANWMVYYSHDWSLRNRRQSEDRAQSLKKQESVLYVDLVAIDTVDEKILETLRHQKNFADIVVGDPSMPWL